MIALQLQRILFSFYLLWAPQPAAADDFHLAPGESFSIKVSGGNPVRVKGRTAIHVEDLGSRLRIVAKEPGHSTINLGAQVHQVYVLPRQQLEFFVALKTLTQTFMGLKADLQDGQVVVVGQLYRLRDWQDIAELADTHGADYQMRARLDKETQDEARTWLQERLQIENLSLPNIIFEPSAKALISTDQKDLATLWDKALAPLGIERTYEKSQIAIETLVRVHIVVAEVNKSMQSQLGIEWPEMISATVGSKLTGPTSLEVFLKAMERDGLGQILASPNLLARSGSEAEFLAGGEFGIKVSTARSKEVIWKHHGIYLKIKPRADRSGRMSIELTTEVSLIDGAQSVDGIPGLKTNRINTHFDLTHPRTIILSGLIRNDWGEERKGVSGLASLPILGRLFRSENFFNNKSELVVFVTPEIVNDAEPSRADLMPKGWITK